jgi:hypothetical protein
MGLDAPGPIPHERPQPGENGRPDSLDLLNENRHGAISTTLSILDAGLGEFLRWSVGRQSASVLFTEANRLAPQQRRAIATEVAAMRQVLTGLRNDLRLAGREHDAAGDIAARCSLPGQLVCDWTPSIYAATARARQPCRSTWSRASRS